MSLSLSDFGRLVGASKVSDMALKLGLDPVPRPLSVRQLILDFGLPLQPTNLRIRWDDIDHPSDETNVVPFATKLVLFEWDDPGKGSQRAATANTVHIQFRGRAKDIIAVPPLNIRQDLDFDTHYLWQVTPQNEFGQGPSSLELSFTTEARPVHPPPPPPPPPPPVKPTISVSSTGSGQTSVFVVTGSGFSPNANVRIRLVDDRLNEQDFQQSADGSGKLNARLPVRCNSGFTLHFSATDARPDPSDLTGVLFSNTFNIPCP